MRGLGCGLVCACLLVLVPAAAQEGHPVVGTWQGDFWTTPDQRQRMVLVMRWDGEGISGIFNPGRNSATLENARLDSSTWTLHFELEVPDASGGTSRFVAEGQMENIGAYNRTLTGTWQQGETRGSFALVRHGL